MNILSRPHLTPQHLTSRTPICARQECIWRKRCLRRKTNQPQQLAPRSSRAEEGASFSPDEDYDQPENARQAIRYGLELFAATKHEDALSLFELALELPGSGIKQYRDKPPKISTAEKVAALYNIACCHSATEKAKDGLLALGACLDLGYTDFDQLRKDQDLVNLREDPRFEPLLQRYEPRARPGILGGFIDALSGK